MNAGPWGDMRTFRKKEEIVTRKIAGETILVPIRGSLADMQKIFSLNPVGDFIWQEINGQKTLQQISESLQSVFDVSQEQADADVQDFITELLREGLIGGAH
jgi:hypothetical protein